MGRKFGISFSAKRALGISNAQAQLSRQLGVPLSRSGRERKLGRLLTGGKCFVATACYQDAEHPDVVLLRRLRDEILVFHPQGRGFIAWYRKYGPVLADAIEARPWLRPICRAGVAIISECVRRAGVCK